MLDKLASRAQELDSTDPLSAARERFLLPEDCVYLNGNSLGPLSKAARKRALQTIDEHWGKDVIASWNKHGWIDLPLRTGDKIGALIGAAPGQVVCCDSISVNLFKLLAQCLSQQDQRHTIVSQQDNFPTDLYIAQGLAGLLGDSRCKLKTVKEGELDDALTEDVAVLLLSHVNFRDGRLHDIRELTERAHSEGVLVIWDLAHSAGVLPLELDEWGVDFAVGCGYKYLNGGPGAPAFIYANFKHHSAFRQPLQGWMGHAAPFDFAPEYEAAPGIASFLTGTPPIISLAVLDASLDVFEGFTSEQIRAKSLALSELFTEAVAAEPALQELRLLSSTVAEERGSQLAYSHAHAYGICRAWAALGVETDFRAPNVLRIGFSPLILSYGNVVESIESLVKVMSEQHYLAEEYLTARPKVT